MGETIQLKAADGFSFSAYVAGPANATKGVVVVQEIFGVNHHIRDMADRFACGRICRRRAGDIRSCAAGCRTGLYPRGHRCGPRTSHEAVRRRRDEGYRSRG